MIRFGRGHRLRHARLQVILAVAAIATAVALPVVLVSVGGGVSAHELAMLQNAGYQIVVSAAGLHGIAHAHPLTEQILSLPSVAAASPVLSIAIDSFPAGPGATPVLAEGVIPVGFGPTLGPEESGLFPLPLPLGDPTDAVHFDNGSYRGPATYDVLVSSPFAEATRVTTGGHLLLGLTNEVSGAISYNVTGTFGVPPTVLGPVGAFAVLVPLSDLQVMTGFANAPHVPVPDAADTVEVAVVPSATSNPEVISSLRDRVQSLVPYYGVSSLSQEATQLQSATAVLTGFYLALSSVGLSVGLVFLTLVLLRRVESERRSIGIRRAIGEPGGSIAAAVVVDGVVIASLGAVVGIAAGYLVVEGLATWAHSTVQEAARLAEFVPLTLTELAGGVVGLSLVAGALAARSALRIDLAEALR
ncbi:MAG: ABC transporter permease [Thermoplasmata archaeon]|nr:ABC transporter permease [Thermoplasmata archaeon]